MKLRVSVLLSQSIVQSNAGIVLATMMPMIFFVIIVVILAVSAVLLGITGIRHLLNRRRTRERLKSTRKESEQSFKEDLPRTIDGITTMTDVVADGVTLTFTFAIDMPAAEMTSEFLDALKSRLAGVLFKRDALLQNLKAGAIYRFQFIVHDAEVLGPLMLTISDYQMTSRGRSAQHTKA